MDINKVVKYLELMSNKHFDGEIVSKFIKKVITYPNGSCVELNSGEKAIVIKANIKEPTKPLVRIYARPNDELYDSFFEVDLNTNTNYSIVKSCNDI